ncbi:MAG: hypothetical protein OXI79_04040 [Gammaproteobacteria bacterium]|nr:hypothetical protein [Gammaproteobacteria bacterium]
MTHSIVAVRDATRRLFARAKAFLAVKRAVSTVEYALIVVAVVAVVGAGAAILGGAFKGLFEEMEDQMEAAEKTVKNAGST